MGQSERRAPLAVKPGTAREHYLAAMATSLRHPGLQFDPVLACRHLSAADQQLGALILRVGAFTLRPPRNRTLFAALARAITYQQLSGKAAATILDRVCALYPGRRFPRPEELLATPAEQLRAAGLSVAKTAYLRDLAQHTLDGTVPSLPQIRRMDDEEVIERLTIVHGVGRWTAQMILIFRLGRPDVLPLEDLGVRKGYTLSFGGRGLASPRVIQRRAERWRPYRSVASWYLWQALEL
jgi:3-methyladenine DNA glycosylase/8-oxoguanine DNA glycosylase